MSSESFAGPQGFRVSAAPRSLQFRVMRVSDLSEVMRNETGAYTYPWTQGIFVDCLRSANECWVATMGDNIVGHGVLSVVAGEGHVLNVCIAAEQQGWGFGRRLLDHLLLRAREGSAGIVFLEVRPSNLSATRLYDSAGFSRVGRRKDYYPSVNGREDALIMARQLSS